MDTIFIVQRQQHFTEHEEWIPELSYLNEAAARHGMMEISMRRPAAVLRIIKRETSEEEVCRNR